ncbi:hypothetical protein [Serratia proteamaculans]|uniref:hypothetical protein n=1 Tax=Serratia proteamaculans TaxID=28151 RepID=UPI001020F950|nr:hypothetical protein [Serratia proteamaculans]
MSVFSGTPGPWSQDEYGNVVHGAKDGFGRMEKVRVSGVALPNRVTQEYAANTRLVVAAPELLEALQGLVHADCHSVRNSTVHIKALNNALLAINKALGR